MLTVTAPLYNFFFLALEAEGEPFWRYIFPNETNNHKKKVYSCFTTRVNMLASVADSLTMFVFKNEISRSKLYENVKLFDINR